MRPAEQHPERAAQPAEGAHPMLVVERARGDEAGESVHEPAKLLRIATMIRALVEEVRTADLNEAGRERLTDVHNRSLEMLQDVLSDDLEEELSQVALSQLEGEPPSPSELRVAQAQLAGWLEGLFHGIQASIASQQMSAQEQLAQMRQQGRPSPGAEQDDQEGGRGGSGQYL